METKAVKDYKRFVSATKADEVIGYECPRCQVELKALKPPAGEVWDSVTMCPYCEGFFVKVVSSGEVICG